MSEKLNTENLQFENKQPRLWLECLKTDYNYILNINTDEIFFYIYDPIFKISSEDKALSEMADFLTNNFNIISEYFPIFKRLKEIVKIMSMINIIENITPNQIKIETFNYHVENNILNILQQLPKLPSQYIKKKVDVKKSRYVNAYNSNTGSFENHVKYYTVQEYKNVYDPTDYNIQLKLNMINFKLRINNLFNIFVDETLIGNLCKIEDFSKSEFQLHCSEIEVFIKTKQENHVKDCLLSMKKKLIDMKRS